MICISTFVITWIWLEVSRLSFLLRLIHEILLPSEPSSSCMSRSGELKIKGNVYDVHLDICYNVDLAGNEPIEFSVANDS